MKSIKTEYILLVTVLLVTAFAYVPALDSRLLLDDFYNLNNLEDVAVKGYANFIFSGFAGPSGRPVSMLSFALQHEQWPHGRFAFKLVNLIIHLLSGILIYFITRFLSEHTSLNRKQGGILALITTFLWLIHPLQISTVLYVVQRMTLLSGFFTLSGVLVYLILWRSEAIYQSTKHLLILSLLFGASLVCAVFSKENGILLPVLVMAMEFTILYEVKRPGIWKAWAGVFLLLPCIVVLIYLANGFDGVVAGYEIRPYNMSERLLTESRILFQYLYNIVLPRPSAFSLYHDDFNFSTGLFSPTTTLVSVIGILFLGMIGFIGRKKIPVPAFSVLWFLGAHLIESTYLNLELYFEHRNYLPAYSICFLIAWLCLKIFGYIRNRTIGFCLVLAVILPTVIVTLMEIDLWSKPIEQAFEWQRRSPDSRRAREDIGNLYIIKADADKALEVYQEMKKDFPEDIYPYIKAIDIKSCLQKIDVPEEDWEAAFDKAYQAKWQGLAPIAEIDTLTFSIQKNKCKNINVYSLIKFVIILAHNPEFRRTWGILHELAAILNLEIGESEAALNNISRALELRKTSTNYSIKAKIFLGLGQFEEARVTLAEFRQYLNDNKRAYLANKGILLNLEKKLAEIKSADGANLNE